MEDEMKKVTGIQITYGQLATLFGIVVLAASLTIPAIGQTAAAQTTAAQTLPQTFKTPAEAANAMFVAAKAGNSNELMRIFGPQAKGLLSSGDPVADKNEREQIITKYEQMHRIVIEPDKTATLYIGAENWPFPIPIVNKKGEWSFDTARGKQEVLFRRIGRNETATIDTLAALVRAQSEYFGTTRQYAEKIMSDEGKQNGLYWKPVAGQPPSPIGPLVAEATKEGYKKGEGPTPFHGYVYRMLTSQGKDAPGGAMSYMTDGKQTKGFAFVAYPAHYRNSGVMTFIVSKDGTIYQKDLGPRTSSLAAAMIAFNPDKTWTPAE